MVRRTVQGVATLLLVALAGCTSSSDADRGSAASTVATEPPTTTTTNPYAVPAVIDATYVNRVLAGLDAQMGEVTRMVIRSRTITTDAYDRMRAVYHSNEFLQLAIEGFEADMREGFKSYKPNPGNTVSSVSRLIAATPTCIFAQVQRDYSNVGLNPSPDTGVQWVVLTPLDRSRDPHGHNRTFWAFTFDGVRRDRSQPPNPCGA